ncbi:hypothetical protein I4F81_004860 [Pyropia yezoensis]|uniref:Uncharacterized protein n=1 Tax=Pyropia yezoensis TaxID=2788 RepID=A0ACC3BX69_PYRYE|nr:hypothetical protein I4F81_004860 [Neopyropia yezoensis]
MLPPRPTPTGAGTRGGGRAGCHPLCPVSLSPSAVRQPAPRATPRRGGGGWAAADCRRGEGAVVFRRGAAAGMAVRVEGGRGGCGSKLRAGVPATHGWPPRAGWSDEVVGTRRAGVAGAYKSG